MLDSSSNPPPHNTTTPCTHDNKPLPRTAVPADAEVADGLAAALCALSLRHPHLELAEPGGARYPGAYRLLAHPSAHARRLVRGRGLHGTGACCRDNACWPAWCTVLLMSCVAG